MAKHGMKSMQEYKVTIKSLSEQLGTTLSQIVDQKELVKCLEARLRETVERAAEELEDLKVSEGLDQLYNNRR